MITYEYKNVHESELNTLASQGWMVDMVIPSNNGSSRFLMRRTLYNGIMVPHRYHN